MLGETLNREKAHSVPLGASHPLWTGCVHSQNQKRLALAFDRTIPAVGPLCALGVDDLVVNRLQLGDLLRAIGDLRRNGR